jgi:molybdopterin/thiamine biosynthesis adenylyltransferase
MLLERFLSMTGIDVIKTPEDLERPPLSENELARYSRQLNLEGFGGPRAQQRLKSAAVAVSRCGGVGGTVCMLLARAGIGKLILAHGGHISWENLNRMPLAYTSDLDRPYTEAFMEKLCAINPEVELSSILGNIDDKNAYDFVSQADIIADGAPLFEERYAMNAEAVRQDKPLVSGAMYDLEGYVTTIVPGVTPCLACIYPTRPDYWIHGSVFPVIAPISTIVGSIMAMEIIKLLTGVGETLKNRLWRFDIRDNWARQFNVKRRKDCAVCSPTDSTS